MANRLAQETSPYLLQHADNPVDWFPWGDEAKAKAKAEDKPLLLSIGYAACHWCHVMERESFEDESVAAVMNEHFVNVKVDREERPDVDAVYMAATQALTGHGGWPMTVFATPDGIPFLCGTYFPPEERQGMPSFRRVLEHVHELWTTRRNDLLTQGQRIVDAIAKSTPPASIDPLERGLLSAATAQLVGAIDTVNGGFGGAPKFPQAPALELLLRRHDNPGARDGIVLTLRKMALGGIYDQLGGGFARYAVDATWTVPHFEKMLYDNAQLARVYTHAWQAFGDPLFRRIAEETLDYLLYDMRDDAGGFHSAEDADSEGEEGRFYAWTRDEMESVAPEAVSYYGLDAAPNFDGRYVLTAASDDPPQQARERLLATRGRRVRPGRDDKVLASWNGLAIAALAEAGAAFDRPDFIEVAQEVADFILTKMRSETGRLLHSWRAGRAQIDGFLEDYAYVADALLALWESTFDQRYAQEAKRLATEALDLFGDSAGGFYSSTHDLVVKQKEIIESATPAPGGVLALVLQKLAVLFDDNTFSKPAVDSLRIARMYMERAPQAVPTWLCALDFYLSTPTEVAFTGDLATDEGKALVDVVHSRFLPNKVLAAGEADGIALLRDKPSTTAPQAFVCERYVCKQPTSSPEELAKLLG